MSERNTTRTARNLVAVFAVALLCAAAMAVVLVNVNEGSYATGSDSTDGGTDAGDETEKVKPTYTFTYNITKGTGSTVTYDKDAETAKLKITASSGYVVPTSLGSGLSGTVTTKTYTPTTDRSSATITLTGVKSNITVTLTCESKVDVYVNSIIEGKDHKEKLGTYVPGTKVEGTFDKEPGYNIPSSIIVNKGGSQMSDGFEYDASKGKFTLDGKIINGSSDIIVSGTYTNKEYTFTSSIIGGDVDKKADVKPVHNNSLQFKITAGPHYDLPDPRDVTVTNDGKNKSYTYDATTGIVKIGKVEGNITVTAKCNAETFTVTYYDSDKKTELDMEPSRFSYGIGCTLPTNVVKTDYIFTGWVDEAGRPIAAVDKTWAPSDGKEGNVNVYATFKDDLSKYDVGDYQMPYLIAAILSMVALIAVPVIVKVRK